jgi:hypothetical protein
VPQVIPPLLVTTGTDVLEPLDAEVEIGLPEE